MLEVIFQNFILHFSLFWYLTGIYFIIWDRVITCLSLSNPHLLKPSISLARLVPGKPWCWPLFVWAKLVKKEKVKIKNKKKQEGLGSNLRPKEKMKKKKREKTIKEKEKEKRERRRRGKKWKRKRDKRVILF